MQLKNSLCGYVLNAEYAEFWDSLEQGSYYCSQKNMDFLLEDRGENVVKSLPIMKQLTSQSMFATAYVVRHTKTKRKKKVSA